MKLVYLAALALFATPVAALANANVKTLTCNYTYTVGADLAPETFASSVPLTKNGDAGLFASLQSTTKDGRFTVTMESYKSDIGFSEGTVNVSNVYITTVDNKTKAKFLSGNPYVFQVKKDVLSAYSNIMGGSADAYPRLEVSCELL